MWTPDQVKYRTMICFGGGSIQGWYAGWSNDSNTPGYKRVGMFCAHIRDDSGVSALGSRYYCDYYFSRTGDFDLVGYHGRAFMDFVNVYSTQRLGGANGNGVYGWVSEQTHQNDAGSMVPLRGSRYYCDNYRLYIGESFGILYGGGVWCNSTQTSWDAVLPVTIRHSDTITGAYTLDVIALIGPHLFHVGSRYL